MYTITDITKDYITVETNNTSFTYNIDDINIRTFKNGFSHAFGSESWSEVEVEDVKLELCEIINEAGEEVPVSSFKLVELYGIQEFAVEAIKGLDQEVLVDLFVDTQEWD